jgi:hypothetical protein
MGFLENPPSLVFSEARPDFPFQPPQPNKYVSGKIFFMEGLIKGNSIKEFEATTKWTPFTHRVPSTHGPKEGPSAV